MGWMIRLPLALLAGLLIVLLISIVWDYWKETHNPYEHQTTDAQWSEQIHTLNVEKQLDDTAGIDTQALNLWIDLDAILDPILANFNQRIDALLEEWNAKTWANTETTVRKPTLIIPGRPPNTWSPRPILHPAVHSVTTQ